MKTVYFRPPKIFDRVLNKLLEPGIKNVNKNVIKFCFGFLSSRVNVKKTDVALIKSNLKKDFFHVKETENGIGYLSFIPKMVIPHEECLPK